MHSRARKIAPLALALALAGCSSSDDPAPDGQIADGRPASTRADGGPRDSIALGDGDWGGPGPAASCAPLSPVQLASPKEVGDEASLRAALAAGGEVRVTADITATAPFEIKADTVLDGGGHTIDQRGEPRDDEPDVGAYEAP